MRVRLALVVAVTSIASVACVQQEVPAAPFDNIQLVQGQEIWSKNCASCHGRSGQGGRGSKLNEGRVVERFPNVADEIEVVAGGRRAMPGFGSKLTPEELEAVVAYTREVL